MLTLVLNLKINTVSHDNFDDDLLYVIGNTNVQLDDVTNPYSVYEMYEFTPSCDRMTNVNEIQRNRNGLSVNLGLNVNTMQVPKWLRDVAQWQSEQHWFVKLATTS